MGFRLGKICCLIDIIESRRGKPGIGYRPSYIFGRGTPRCPYKEGMQTAPQEVSAEPRAGKVWSETSDRKSVV